MAELEVDRDSVVGMVALKGYDEGSNPDINFVWIAVVHTHLPTYKLYRLGCKKRSKIKLYKSHFNIRV